MKKIQFALVAGFVCAISVVSNTSAQTSKSVLSATKSESFGSLYSVNSRAIRDFKKNFPGVTGENWRDIKDGWQASFTQNDIRSAVVYNRRGNWHYTINYYDEKKLPADVRAQVKSIYYDYSITGVEEIHVEDKIIYLVHMQDEKTWKKVRVCDGEMDIIEDFNKQ